MGRLALLGVTGGIAAYKTPILVRLLVQSGWDVHVVMTKAAAQFVTPLTLATVSEHPVHQDMWRRPSEPSMEHISLPDKAQAAVIAPATANMIGKIASGIADDLLSTMIMACTCPVLICPSMNMNMYRNPVLQSNLAKLKGLGYHILEPESGFLACGWVGEGRLPEPEVIAEAVDRIATPKDLAGEKVLVTAGPTEEPLDPVRYIANRSSGKMGVAIARRAFFRGADVTLVAGPLKIDPPACVKYVPVRTARDMFERVTELAEEMTVIIKAAAVADFRPVRESKEKVKKEEAESHIALVRNPDILFELGRQKKKDQILVGFAAETRDALDNGRRKLAAKNLDILVLNDVSKPGAGFDLDTNIVHLLHHSGEEEQLDILPKEVVADVILDRIRDLRQKPGSETKDREQALH